MLKDEEFLYSDLTYKINGILFAVHNELGRFAREKQYCNKLEERFKETGIPFQRELAIGDSGNICDFVINDLIILEVKAKPFLQNLDFEQVKRYLHCTNLKLGMLVNFHAKYLKPQRVLKASHL